jgi:RNA polymerase sigma-70 factor (ECF subfamily)
MSAAATFENRVAAVMPDLFRFAMSITRNREAADDLSQDAAALALTKRDDFEPGTDLKAWLFKLQVNLHRNSVRKELRRRRLEETHSPIQANDLALPSQMDSLRYREAYKAIEGLPPLQRQVLFLVVHDGKTYEEAAQILEIDKGTVKSRLNRARQALAEAIDYEQGREVGITREFGR